MSSDPSREETIRELHRQLRKGLSIARIALTDVERINRQLDVLLENEANDDTASHPQQPQQQHPRSERTRVFADPEQTEL